MKLLKATILAAALALPFTVSGGETAVSERIVSAPAAAGEELRSPENYDCCWYYFMGRWYCVSCVFGG